MTGRVIDSRVDLAHVQRRVESMLDECREYIDIERGIPGSIAWRSRKATLEEVLRLLRGGK